MKTKHILKTIGLATAFSFSSIVLISCDDDNNSSSSIGAPQDANELSNGGTITIIEDGSEFRFVITDIESRTGNLTDDYDFTLNNLNYAYDASNSQSITFTDNRVTSQAALAEFNQLTGDGGSAQDELNALLANDNAANINNLIEAVNSITGTERFILSSDNDTRVFIVRELTFSTSNITLNGLLVEGESHPFIVGGTTQEIDPSDFSITYTAP